MGLLVGKIISGEVLPLLKLPLELVWVEPGLQIGERFTVYRVDDLF